MSAAAAKLPEPPVDVTKKAQPAPTKPLTLNARVDAIEERLKVRHKAIAARTSAVFQDAGKKLGSPITMLLAVGGGIALGYCTRSWLAKSKTQRRREQREPERVVARRSIFATLLDAFTLMTTVLSMIPSFASMVPSFGRRGDAGDEDPR